MTVDLVFWLIVIVWFPSCPGPLISSILLYSLPSSRPWTIVAQQVSHTCEQTMKLIYFWFFFYNNRGNSFCITGVDVQHFDTSALLRHCVLFGWRCYGGVDCCRPKRMSNTKHQSNSSWNILPRSLFVSCRREAPSVPKLLHTQLNWCVFVCHPDLHFQLGEILSPCAKIVIPWPSATIIHAVNPATRLIRMVSLDGSMRSCVCLSVSRARLRARVQPKEQRFLCSAAGQKQQKGADCSQHAHLF